MMPHMIFQVFSTCIDTVNAQDLSIVLCGMRNTMWKEIGDIVSDVASITMCYAGFLR